MKIEREDGPAIIVGKRITLGAIIGGVVTTGVYLIEYMQGIAVPAPVAIAVTTVITGLVQLWVVNRYGVTK
jgi:hypothetical protein